MRSRSLRFVFVGGSILGVAIVVACSSGEERPPAIEDPNVQLDSSYVPRDGATQGEGGGGDGGGEAGVEFPKSCSNTIRDSKETDTDCGGSECPQCIDGKVCVADTDCKGGSCVNKQCVTPACTDGNTNGGESDTDCGGSTCARCTTGKKCATNADCLSGTCTNQSCGCPANMAIVAKATGGAYCIDSAEVTKGQYNKFLTANVPVTEQTAVCKDVNTTFVPRGAWPPAQSPPGGTQGLQYNLGLPVHYTDWCDAYAYCRWANKQLCGNITGGSAPTTDANDATKDAWFNACSAQGSKAWPYSSAYDSSKCNGDPVVRYDAGATGGTTGDPAIQYGFGAANQDQGIWRIADGDQSGSIQTYLAANCQGGSVFVYQMSGNVAEWEDSCADTTPGAECKVRGGSFLAGGDSTALRCDASRNLARIPPAGANPDTDPLRDVGFRCCLF
jgi:formylglycine-generating enzyme required for sulfatase activity